VIQVVIREGENIERALRRFRRQVDAAGVLKDVRRREHYEKPSVRKKEKMRAAQRRRRRSAQRSAQRSFG